MYIATNIYIEHLVVLWTSFEPRSGKTSTYSNRMPPHPHLLSPVRCVALVAVCFVLLLLLIVFLSHEKLVPVPIFYSNLKTMIGKCLTHFGTLLGLMETVSYAIYRINVFSLLYFVQRIHLAEVELYKLDSNAFHLELFLWHIFV